jgi:hypothetical protein
MMREFGLTHSRNQYSEEGLKESIDSNNKRSLVSGNTNIPSQILILHMEEEDARIVAAEMARLALPLEQVVTDKIEQARKEQAVIIEKILDLTKDLEKVESVMPESNLENVTAKFNEYSDRLEGCRKRVQAVKKRADAMLSKLGKPKSQPKIGVLIDLS